MLFRRFREDRSQGKLLSLKLDRWLQRIIIYGSINPRMGFPGDSVVKNLLINAGDIGSIPGWGRPPREGNSNLL